MAVMNYHRHQLLKTLKEEEELPAKKKLGAGSIRSSVPCAAVNSFIHT